jgi:NAD(P)H-hydrate epimerase
MFSPIGDIPYITTEQMKEVDRKMIDDYHIEFIQMMENAGRNLAHLARTRFLNGNPIGKKVIVLAGAGGNGGGALVCARRLHNWGSSVSVFIAKQKEDFTEVPAHQVDILLRMHVLISPAQEIEQVKGADLIVDGLIGYGLTDAPSGSAADLIRWSNAKDIPILSLDVPSGVDAATGSVLNPAIKATATMTLALPKEGLRAPGTEKQVGELYLADISVPPSLYGELAFGTKVSALFASDEILRVY